MTVEERLRSIRSSKYGNKQLQFNEIRYILTMEQHYFVPEDAEMSPEIRSLVRFVTEMLTSSCSEDINFAVVTVVNLIEFVGEIVLCEKPLHQSIIRCTANSDPLIASYSARLLSYLVLHGFSPADTIKEELKMRIKNLSDENSENRYLSILIVREMAYGSPYTFYQYIQQFVEHIFVCFKDPLYETQIVAADTIRSLLTILAERELFQKSAFNWYQFIYDKMLRLLPSMERSMAMRSSVEPEKPLSRSEDDDDHLAHSVLLLLNEFVRQCSLDLEVHKSNLIEIFPIRVKASSSSSATRQRRDTDEGSLEQYGINSSFDESERSFATRSKNTLLHRYYAPISPELEKYRLFLQYNESYDDFLGNLFGGGPAHEPQQYKPEKSSSVVGCYSQGLSLMIQHSFDDVLKFCFVSLGDNINILVAVCRIIPNVINVKLSLFKHTVTQNIILKLINIFPTSVARPHILLCFTLLGRLLKDEFLFQAKHILCYIKSLYMGDKKDIVKNKIFEMEAPIACFLCSMIQSIGQPFIECISMEFVEACISNMVFDFSVAAIFSEITTCPSKSKASYQSAILQYLRVLLGFNLDCDNLCFGQKPTSGVSSETKTTTNFCNEPYSDSISDDDKKTIITALIALRMCEFGFESMDEIVISISNTYLKSPCSAIREEAAKTCIKLMDNVISENRVYKSQCGNEDFGVLSNYVFTNINNTSVSFGSINDLATTDMNDDATMSDVYVLEILSIITGIAIGDVDERTRLNVLRTLSSKFYPHLLLIQNVQCLILGLRDPKYEIRCVVTALLGKLVALQPFYLFPVLEKYLVETLSYLEMDLLIADKGIKEKSAVLLNTLIVSCSRLAHESVQSILDVIFPIFKDETASTSLICNIMNIIGDLITTCDKTMHKYLPNIVVIIVDILSDPSSSYYKRIASLDVLSHILNSSGYVFQNYFSIHKVVDVLIAYIKSEKTKINRCKAINILGLIGAVNPSKMKVFYSSKEFVRQLDNEGETGTFHNDINSPSVPTTADNEVNTCEFYINNRIQSLEELYPLAGIESLLMVLTDPCMVSLQSVVLHELERVLIFLGKKSVQYAPRIFNAYFKIVKTDNIDIRLIIIQQINKLASLIGCNLCAHLAEMFQMINDLWTCRCSLTLQVTLMQLVDNLVSSLPHETKIYFKLILPKTSMILNNELDTDYLSEDEINILKTKTISTLQHIVPYMIDFLHVIVPIIVSTYASADNLIPLRRLAMETIHIIAGNTNLSEFASPIMQSLVKVVETCPELQSIALSLISSLASHFGFIFRCYAPTIERLMSQHQLRNNKYETNLSMIQISSYINKTTNWNPKLNRYDRESKLRVHNTTMDIISNRNKPHFDMLRLKWAWITSNKSSTEDFNNWFKKLCTEFLSNSPSFVLRACSIVCLDYPPITQNLFNCSFVSVWCELNHELKTNLFHSIADALTRDYVPRIISILLHLIEFTNYVELDFCIDEDVIAKSACSVDAYTIALYYKERQFKKNPFRTDVLQNIISLNMKLQNMDAAIGVVKYVEENSRKHIDIPEEWYEELHDYEGALNGYDQKLKDNHKNKFILHKKLKCLKSLGRWNELRSILNSADVYESAHSTSADSSTDGITSNIFIAMIGASTCVGLSDFVTLENEYLPRIPHDSFLGYFYNSIVSIYNKQYSTAQSLINSSRGVLDSELTGIHGDTYNHYYDSLVYAQLLTEMNEVVEYALTPAKQDKIKLNWKSRIERCNPVVEDWETILNLRSIVVPPMENVDSWLKFANLSRKFGKVDLAGRIFANMLHVHESQIPLLLKSNRKIKFHPKILYNFIKFLWHTKSQSIAYEYMGQLVEYLNLQVDVYRKSGSSSASCNSVNLNHLLSKCYLHLSRWKFKLDGDQFTPTNIPEISKLLNYSVINDRYWVKSVHSLAIINYEIVLYYKRELIASKTFSPKAPAVAATPQSAGAISDQRQINLSEMDVANNYASPAIKGLFETMKMAPDFALQDILRIITLWFDFGQYSCVSDVVKKNISSIRIDYWLKVIPQLIARINIPKPSVASLIRQLLIDIGKNHPQSLIYPIAVASNRAAETNQMNNIRPIITSLQEHSNALMGQAMLVSHELIRVSVSWVELAIRVLEEIFFAFNHDKSIQKILYSVDKINRIITSKDPETNKECLFKQCYQKNLLDLARLVERYRTTYDETAITGVWAIANDMYTRLNKEVQCYSQLDLCTSSPKLLACSNMELAVPSTYEPNKPIVSIERIFPRISIMKSKQRPRKLTIIGSNGKEFVFLLKGNEDLRQDERVMQLFKLINSLLTKDTEALQRELFVTRYAVIPLSVNSGLIGWVPDCDTLNSLIVERRTNRRLNLNSEKNALSAICPFYQSISLVHKIHAFERALLATDGEDIAESLYRRSPSCDIWFSRRRVYSRSLAAMSIVGYILGLGDRHLSNMMMDKNTGRVVHIDFGDCFEVCMTRSSFPEKVPFRLTRVLVKALEVTGINGTFRVTCDHVMRVLRQNKESVFAVLEAFIYDPLISWRLFEVDKRWADATLVDPKLNLPGSFPPDPTSLINNLSSVNYKAFDDDEEIFNDNESINKKGLQIICRIRDKLSGKDFKNTEPVSVHEQTFLLINEATSIENLCQAYIGWAPLI